MSREEYKQYAALAASPETLAEAIEKITAGVEENFAESDKLKESLAEKEKKINELNEQRIKDLLKATGEAGHDEPEEPEEDFRKEFREQFGIPD